MSFSKEDIKGAREFILANKRKKTISRSHRLRNVRKRYALIYGTVSKFEK